jgi:hypothetical protein
MERFERMAEEEQLEPREDRECFCPRVQEEVLVLSNCCFFRERAWSCFGCVFNRDFVRVKLTILLKELLERRDRQNG